MFSLQIEIGYEGADSDHVLSTPRDVALDDFGRIYVLDNRSVKVFDTGGRFLELIQPEADFKLSHGDLGIDVTGDGTVYIWDPQKQQMVTYSSQADQFSLKTVFGTAAYGMPAPIEVDDGGRVGLGFRVAGVGNAVAEGVRIIQAPGQDSLLGPFASTTSLKVSTDKTTSVVSLPFDLASRTQWTLSPYGEVLTVNTRDYHVAAMVDLDTMWTISGSARPIRVRKRDREHALGLAGTTGVTEEMIRGLIPATKSSVLELWMSREWIVVRLPTNSPDSYETVYDLYRTDTRTLCATVALPARILDVRGTLAGGLSYRADALPTVQVYSFRERRE